MNSLRRYVASLSSILPTLVGLLRGALWAGLWGSWALTGYFLFGDSLAARTGIIGGIATGIGLGTLLFSSLRPVKSGPFTQSLSILTGYVLTASTSLWLLAGWNRLVSSLLAFAPQSVLWETVSLWFSLSLFALTPFALALLTAFFFQRFFIEDKSSSGPTAVSFAARTELFGAAICLLFLFPELSRLIGWTALNLSGACIGLVLIVAAVLRPAWRSFLLTHDVSRQQPSWISLLGISAGAVLWVALERAAAQLVPSTTEILVACWGATLLGLACGGILSRRKLTGFFSKFTGLQEQEVLVWLLCSLAAIASFPLGIRYSIWVVQSVNGPWWAYMARMLLTTIYLFPVGALIGASVCTGRLADVEQKSNRSIRCAGLTLFAFTWSIASWILPTVGVVSLTGLAVALVVLSICLAAIGNGGVRSETKQHPLLAWGGIVGSLALVLITSLTYHPSDATLWISASRSFDARSAGMGNPVIPYLNDLRLVGERRGANGQLTLWTSREAGLQIWKNGVPVSTFSADTGIHPDYAGELLLSVLPLSMHPASSRVLVLGLGGGTPLAAALDAPVQQIDCVEKDPDFASLIHQRVRSEDAPDWNDSRLRIWNLDPLAWLTASREQYDVVISNSPPIAFPEGAATFTTEYYQRVSRNLAEGGLFCQRFQCLDFGFQPFAQVVATLRESFSDVLVIETSANDFLLLGSNAPAGIVQQDLVDRIQAPQVSKTVSRLGWDGLLAMTIPVANKAALEKIVPSGTPTLSGFDGRFAFAWPREISRAGNKVYEVHAQLAGKTGRLIDLLPEKAESPFVLRRLAEIQSQNDLIVKYPDQYWAYRKNAREEVSKNPKSLVDMVSYELSNGKLDPEDRQRMLYFALLGRAANTLDPEKIAKLEQFLTPFDPILTPFIPQEIAELYARAGHPEPEAELRHRLYRIYYSGPADRSVLYVTDALELINKFPEAVPEASQRWYTQSSLLQVLKQRWDFRMSGKPGLPRIMYRDVQLSVAAIEQTLASMRETCVASGVTPEENSRRAMAIQKTLLTPLQRYGKSFAPYLTPSELANLGSSRKPSREPAAEREVDEATDEEAGVEGVQAN